MQGGEKRSQQSPPTESTPFTAGLQGGERKGCAHVEVQGGVARGACTSPITPPAHPAGPGCSPEVLSPLPWARDKEPQQGQMKPKLNPGPNPAEQNLALPLLGLQAQGQDGIRPSGAVPETRSRPRRRGRKEGSQMLKSQKIHLDAAQVDVDLTCLRRSGWGVLLYGRLLPSLHGD